MYTNKDNSHDSDQRGQDAEDLFVSMAKERHIEVKEATDEENIYEHWDFKLTKGKVSHKVDVKGMKRTDRSQKQEDSTIYIEFKNNYGDKGWIYSKADQIAFQVAEGFIIVSRKALLKHVKKLVGPKPKVRDSVNNKHPYILYTRKKQWKKDDVFCIIKKKDLYDIKHILWRFNDKHRKNKGSKKNTK